MKMLKTAKTLLFILLATVPAFAQTVKTVGASDVAITRTDDALSLAMKVNPADYSLKSNTQWKVTPVVISSDSTRSAEMKSFIVTGKNAWYYAQRQALDKDVDLLRSGSSTPYAYTCSVPYQKWMEHSTVKFNIERISCCGDKPLSPLEAEPVAELNFVPATYQATFTYQTPIDDGKKERNLSGRAYVNFIVNKTNIVPTYMNNAVELRKILNTIDSVKLNKDATVDLISLTGYASPEGPYNNNVRLAQGRVIAVKDYVKALYDFPERVYKTNSVPEDWDGLREYVASSNLEDRDAILEFIDQRTPIEQRNDLLRKKFPKSYAFLLANEYPWLRHTDYYIHYIVRQYTTVEEILEAMAVNPANLSMGEFFKAAKSFPEGSEEFCDILEKAADYYKTDPVANLNAANAAMSRGDYRRAASYLKKAGDSSEAEYMRGVLAALQSNYPDAIEHLKNANSDKARQAIDQIKLIESSKEQVKYLQ